MAALGKKLRTCDSERIAFWCPGCERAHVIRIGAKPDQGWTFDGNIDAPAFAPSIKVTYRHPKGHSNENPAPIGYAGEYVEDICHSFVRKGMVEFCGDSTHTLAGKIVPLPDFPICEE